MEHKAVVLPHQTLDLVAAAIGKGIEGTGERVVPRIITPVGESWDRWFDEPCMSADFMAEREQPTAQEREKL
ncbi:AbrB/MazE/SpoVT family DNA-binding domain-containing protein [Aeromonas caviae]|uniref:AbrB/MazE/SpoVT family DNA-binding domain-containing protein n=2 Tax=Aeromonadaceae TaxID=84642 RepID=UPI003873A152